MAFLKEAEPERGRAHEIHAGILRLVARNSGSMTYHGTNTYLIEAVGGFIVLDPGPATDLQHVADILSATGGRVAGILVSHGHHDHVGAVDALKARTGAPTFGYPKSIAMDFVADVPVNDGDSVAGMRAIHTPGHAPDHLCFARDDGLVFTADHIMGWSSSVVSPPNGNMADYIASLDVMIRRDDRIYLPGHGPALATPRRYVEDIKRRRMERERAILATLLRDGPMSVPELALKLYAKTDPLLQNAAERNVISHLHKLGTEHQVEEDDTVWMARG